MWNVSIQSIWQCVPGMHTFTPYFNIFFFVFCNLTKTPNFPLYHAQYTAIQFTNLCYCDCVDKIECLVRILIDLKFKKYFLLFGEWQTHFFLLLLCVCVCFLLFYFPFMLTLHWNPIPKVRKKYAVNTRIFYLNEGSTRTSHDCFIYFLFRFEWHQLLQLCVTVPSLFLSISFFLCIFIGLKCFCFRNRQHTKSKQHHCRNWWFWWGPKRSHHFIWKIFGLSLWQSCMY